MAAHIEQLSDDVLIKILRHTTAEDNLNLYHVNQRFRNLSQDRELVRYSTFTDCYTVSASHLKDYTSRHANHIQVLNLSHCYWFGSRELQAAINRCHHLTALHIIDCSLSMDALANVLARCEGLQTLSFSVKSYLDLKKEKLEKAASVMRCLKRLYIFFAASSEAQVLNYIGEHPTILDLCEELTSLEIGAVGVILPVIFRPVITNRDHFKKLHSYTLTDSIHGSAQMFFYGVLSQLPLPDIHWKSLIIPNINFPAFSSNEQFAGCFHHLEKLESFCASYGRIFPNKTLSLDKCRELRYLNLRGSNVDSKELSGIAESCSKLTTLNLHQCTEVFSKKEDGNSAESVSGFHSLVTHCQNLQHLNLGNIHCHDSHLQEIRNTLLLAKGLVSLALPACILNNSTSSLGHESEQKRGSSKGKRIMKSDRHGGRETKRFKRIMRVARDSSESQYAPAASTSSQSPDFSEDSGCGCHDNFLASLAAQSPELRELELVGVGFQSAFDDRTLCSASTRHFQFTSCHQLNGVTGAELSGIANWTRLTSLTLAALPGIRNGHFLETITQQCCSLTSLSLAMLGFTGKCVYQISLPAVLANCKQLTDFRIEQPNLILNAPFFQSLHSCHKLQRLCIIAHNSTFSSKDIHITLEKLKRLVVLQLFTGATLAHCKKLRTELKKRYMDKQNRPALCLTIYPLLHTDIADILSSVPAKHHKEILMFHSAVAMRPKTDLSCI